MNVFLGDHRKTFICRWCLSSYKSENLLMLHIPKCENIDITTNIISNESHLHWKKKHFYIDPLYFGIYADLEIDNAIDNSSIGNNTTNIFEQNPVLNGYHIEFGIENVLKSGY